MYIYLYIFVGSMSKSNERIMARKMRAQGYSVKTISRELHVSRSSVSIWVRDISLTPTQLKQLNRNSDEGRAKGRTVTSLMYEQRRKQIRETSFQNANNLLKKLSSREFFIAGLALYWAEGNKKTHSVRFTNSDPSLILFELHWFIHCLDVPLERIGAFVGINQSHATRENEILTYWSHLTGIPVSNFRKSIVKKSESKKIYENSASYVGTLTFFVWKPTELYYKIMGLVEFLGQNKNLPV